LRMGRLPIIRAATFQRAVRALENGGEIGKRRKEGRGGEERRTHGLSISNSFDEETIYMAQRKKERKAGKKLNKLWEDAGGRNYSKASTRVCAAGLKLVRESTGRRGYQNLGGPDKAQS